MSASALDALADTAGGLQRLYFRPPGMFTHAVLDPPELTQLIRDALPQEQALYARDGSRMRRIDGSRLYGPAAPAATNPDGLMVVAGDTLAFHLYVRRRASGASLRKPRAPDLPAVQVPRATAGSTGPGVSTPAVPRGLFDQQCAAVAALVEKYPVAGAAERLAAVQQRERQLTQEIAELELLVEAQRLEASRLAADPPAP